MSRASTHLHPKWDLPPEGILDGFSIEITAKDIVDLRKAARHMPPDTPVAITFLPGEEFEARLAAAVAVREMGFEPMPHFSARRILSNEEFETYLEAVYENAEVRRCFVVAGDPPEPQGPFFDTTALIDTGAFERIGDKGDRRWWSSRRSSQYDRSASVGYSRNEDCQY